MGLLTKLEIYGVIIVVVALAAFGWGEYRHYQGTLDERAIWEKKQGEAAMVDFKSLKDAVDKSNQIATATQEKLDKNAAVRVIDRGVIQREIQTNTLYSSDCFPASGLVQWNRISAGQPLVPIEQTGQQADPKMPARNVAPSAGQQGRHIAPKSPGR